MCIYIYSSFSSFLNSHKIVMHLKENLMHLPHALITFDAQQSTHTHTLTLQSTPTHRLQ